MFVPPIRLQIHQLIFSSVPTFGKNTCRFIEFQYNRTFTVLITRDSKYFVLKEEKETVLFVLNNRAEPIGNAITVSCLRPFLSQIEHFYDLTVDKWRSKLKFQSVTKNIRSKVFNPPSLGFLLVPSEFIWWGR